MTVVPEAISRSAIRPESFETATWTVELMAPPACGPPEIVAGAGCPTRLQVRHRGAERADDNAEADCCYQLRQEPAKCT